MSNYFYDMLPAEEAARLKYIPTVPEFVEWMEKQYASCPAISDTQVTYTYSQFCERIARRRAFLNQQGLSKGAKVAIFDRNSINAIELFLAAISAGYVAMFLPSSLPAPAVVGSCMRFDVEALFVRDEFKPLTEGVKAKVFPADSMADETAPVVKVDKEDPAAIFFTGGTTGAPKGVVLPHRALMRGSLNGVYSPGPQISCHKVIGFLPLSHVFGLICGTMSVFYAGNLLVTAEDMKATIGKLPYIQPTYLVLVPGLCEVLLGLTKMYGVNFLGGKMKTIIAGAANVPPRQIEAFDQLGISLLGGYGMTEGANLSSGNADVKTHPTSVGKLYPGQEGKIVDGELWLKGDNLMTGYYKDPENTKAMFTEDGWLKTGDLARFDEDGYLYIVGRIKNLIILSNGENVSPEEIEEPFYKNPCVKDCLVSEGELNGEQVITIEILPQMPAFEGKEWSEIEAYMNKLVADVNATLPTTHRIAKTVVRQEDFKRTGSLKVSRNQ